MPRYSILQCASPFYYQGNETGVLLIHGFTGTTQSMRFLGEEFRDAGYTVSAPRLAGHGTAPQDMEVRTYIEWMHDVEDAYAELKEKCDNIFVVGLSMGGTLALHLAEKYNDITGVVPINAAIEMPEFKKTYKDYVEQEERFVTGIGSDIKEEGIKELAYRQAPVKSMEQLLLLMDEVKEKLSIIKMPALIFSSEVDHVVPPENSQLIYNHIQSDEKEFVKLEDSYHVATIDHDKELIVSKCLQFFKKYETKRF